MLRPTLGANLMGPTLNCIRCSPAHPFDLEILVFIIREYQFSKLLHYLYQYPAEQKSRELESVES